MLENMVFAFWVLSLSLTMTPSPDWAYTMSAGMKGAVWAALSGMLIGYLIVIGTVMAGVGALGCQSPVFSYPVDPDQFGVFVMARLAGTAPPRYGAN